MNAKEMSLKNINCHFRYKGYDYISTAIMEKPDVVLSELVDMVCSIVDRINEERDKKEYV